MAKEKGLYYAVGVINRGRKDEVLPGTLFVPHEDDVDLFVETGVIRPAEEAEIALWEKQQASAKGSKAKADKPAAADASEDLGA